MSGAGGFNNLGFAMVEWISYWVENTVGPTIGYTHAVELMTALAVGSALMGVLWWFRRMNH